MLLLSGRNRCTGTEVSIAITLVYSPRARLVRELVLHVPQGATVAQALQCSGLFNDGVPEHAGQGVWGRKVALGHVLQANDRLELYRPLTVDPKVARRERFARQGPKRAAGLFAKRRPGGAAGY